MTRRSQGQGFELDGGHLLHVVPVGDDAVLDGVLERQDTTLRLGLVTDVAVLLAHADHHTLVAGATNDRGEHSAGRVVTGKSGLDHTGTIIHNQGRYFVFPEDTSGFQM